MIGIAGNDRQIGARWLVRLRAALLPIPQRAKGNAIAGGKFLLRQIQSPPDDFRLWCSPHPPEVRFGKRLCVAACTRGPLNRLFGHWPGWPNCSAGSSRLAHFALLSALK